MTKKVRPIPKQVQRKIDNLKKKIDKNIVMQKRLHNLNNNLQRSIDLLSNYIEITKVVPVKEGRKKVGERIEVRGYVQWLENFIDEDTGAVLSLERMRVCSIDGKPYDRQGNPLHYYDLEPKV